MLHSSTCLLKLILVLHSTIERFREVVTHQSRLQSGRDGASLRHHISTWLYEHKVAPESAPMEADINLEFRPDDNRYLIVHEFCGLDSQDGESHDLQTIRDFISLRTVSNCSPSERLHLVW